MKKIIRKTMLYKTGVEYGDYTMNHVMGCAHGCKYPCYAYTMQKRFGQIKTYTDWCEPSLVENTLELLTTEIPKLKDSITTVHLCFTTDPFMYGKEYYEIGQMSLAAIRKLNDAGIRCTVLTKGILPVELAELSDKNEYGITVVSLSPMFKSKMEPGAAPIKDRIAALKALHDLGCKTWVSIEPYPTPNIQEQDLSQILDQVSFTDRIIFGRMNYNRLVSEYVDHKRFYNEKALEVKDYCIEHKIHCYIKNKTIT